MWRVTTTGKWLRFNRRVGRPGSISRPEVAFCDRHGKVAWSGNSSQVSEQGPSDTRRKDYMIARISLVKLLTEADAIFSVKHSTVYRYNRPGGLASTG